MYYKLSSRCNKVDAETSHLLIVIAVRVEQIMSNGLCDVISWKHNTSINTFFWDFSWKRKIVKGEKEIHGVVNKSSFVNECD